ncbi:MAG: hypothetical protein NTX12_08900 [Actinobacteria bacterium]|nr:hypothetical protein [Actinomycetota bacterium]
MTEKFDYYLVVSLGHSFYIVLVMEPKECLWCGRPYRQDLQSHCPFCQNASALREEEAVTQECLWCGRSSRLDLQPNCIFCGMKFPIYENEKFPIYVEATDGGESDSKTNSISQSAGSGHSHRSLNCIECQNEVTRPQNGFSNLSTILPNSVWVTDLAGRRKALCNHCLRNPTIWRRYEDRVNDWKRSEAIGSKVVRKTNSFVFGFVVTVVLVLIAVVLISILLHAGSCLGPEGDYSGCYP